MVCFEVAVNGKRHCLAGVGETGVLSAFVNWVKMPIERESEEELQKLPVQPGAILLTVTGITPERQSVQWGDITHHLQTGDTVTIRLVDVAEHDPWTVTAVLPDYTDGEGEADS